jgi:mannose-6-phosphate isomerase-like protein (cupin superfamily)
MTYTVIHMNDLDRYPSMTGAPILMPLRRRLGLRAFGANCWTAPLGAYVIEPHSEPNGDEELYVVLRGRVQFTLGNDTFEAGPETFIHLPPNTPRAAVAIEPETIVLAIGAKPGEAFEPKSWEEFQVNFAKARVGGEDKARAFIVETLARQPDAWQAAYNAACFEALTGNLDDAFAYLERALALGPPTVRQLAADGTELQALHSDPRWQELLGCSDGRSRRRLRTIPEEATLGREPP